MRRCVRLRGGGGRLGRLRARLPPLGAARRARRSAGGRRPRPLLEDPNAGGADVHAEGPAFQLVLRDDAAEAHGPARDVLAAG